MSTERAFDLRGVLAGIVDSGVIDPGDLAAKALVELPPEHYRDALECVLRGYCAAYLGEVRRRPVSGPQSSGRSVKVLRYRQAAWAQVCAKSLHVGDHRYVAFGDCTAVDLRYAQAERDRLAAEHRDWADRFGRYADLLDRHKAARVADLPAPARATIIEDWSQ